jgi:hypothetical protein
MNEQARRMPGLWVVCILFSLAACYFATLVIRATALGMVVFGIPAAGSLLIAIGLWRQSRAAWWGAAAATLLAGVVACFQLAAEYDRRWAAPDLWFDGMVGVPAWATCVGACLVIFVYLVARYDAYGSAPPRRRWASPTAAVLIVLCAWAWWLWLHFSDEPLRRFPELDWRPPAATEGENCFGPVTELAARIRYDEDVSLDPGSLPLLGSENPEWTEVAVAWLVLNAECLEAVGPALNRERFVAPPPTDEEMLPVRTGAPWHNNIRPLGDLLRVAARLALVNGQCERSVEHAEQMLHLGRMVCADARDVLQWEAGCSLMQSGLAALLDVALSQCTLQSLAAVTKEDVPAEDELRESLSWALAADFAATRQWLAALKAAPFDGPLVRPSAWLRSLLRDQLPALKVNMTTNEFGDAYTAAIGGLARYERPQYPESTDFMHSGPFYAWQGHMLRGRNVIGHGLLRFFPSGSETLRMWLLVADVRLLRLVLGLRRHYGELGALPARLEDLNVALPPESTTDPFTEHPFRYEPWADPPRLVSTGPDQEFAPSDAQHSDDIVIELLFATPTSHHGDTEDTENGSGGQTEGHETRP